MKKCSIEGCERPLLARSWCGTHYARWRAHGTTDLLPPKPPPTEKRCTKCGRTSQASDFYQPRDSWCKACKRAYTRAWGIKNRERKKAADAARYAAMRAHVVELKMSLSCVDCGWSPPTEAETRRLEFDHVDPETKTHYVNRGAAFSYSWSWERIQREISLCEPRCTECHRSRTTALGHRHLRKGIA